MKPTLSHRLVLPTDANHYGTLYAGSLLRMALEASYATAWRHIGVAANIVLRRVMNLECLRPVEIGRVIEIQGLPLHQTRAYLVVGLIGTPLEPQQGPWMEALFGFAQVDQHGTAVEFPELPSELTVPNDDRWQRLHGRMQKLLKIR